MASDENDKRKQRIILTEECHDFCKKNDKASQVIIDKIFAGVDENSLRNTIQTIMKMEDNLKNI